MQLTSQGAMCHKADDALDILVWPQSKPDCKKDRFK